MPWELYNHIRHDLLVITRGMADKPSFEGAGLENNRFPHITRVLRELLAASSSIEEAWSCDPAVEYIFETRGSFCGYRNIQMWFSYLLASRQSMQEYIMLSHGRVPGILEIQRLIENAWEAGLNSFGRIELGGI